MLSAAKAGLLLPLNNNHDIQDDARLSSKIPKRHRRGGRGGGLDFFASEGDLGLGLGVELLLGLGDGEALGLEGQVRSAGRHLDPFAIAILREVQEIAHRLQGLALELTNQLILRALVESLRNERTKKGQRMRRGFICEKRGGDGGGDDGSPRRT